MAPQAPQPSGFSFGLGWNFQVVQSVALGLWWAFQVVNQATMTSILVSIAIITSPRKVLRKMLHKYGWSLLRWFGIYHCAFLCSFIHYQFFKLHQCVDIWCWLLLFFVICIYIYIYIYDGSVYNTGSNTINLKMYIFIIQYNFKIWKCIHFEINIYTKHHTKHFRHNIYAESR